MPAITNGGGKQNLVDEEDSSWGDWVECMINKTLNLCHLRWWDCPLKLSGMVLNLTDYKNRGLVDIVW